MPKDTWNIQLRDRALYLLDLCAGCVPSEVADIDALKPLIDFLNSDAYLGPEQGDSLLAGQPNELTTGTWSALIKIFVMQWHESGCGQAVYLPDLRSSLTTLGADSEVALIDAIIFAMAELAQIRFEGSADEDASLWQLMQPFTKLAKATESAGHADLAYDLASLASLFGKGQGRAAIPTIEYALDLATKANNLGQVVSCNLSLAGELAVDADTNAGGRIEAFEVCEATAERIALLSEDFRAPATIAFQAIVQPRPYLKKLLLPLFLFLPKELQPDDLVDKLGFSKWLTRLSTVKMDQWLNDTRDLRAVSFWDNEIEKERFLIEEQGGPKNVHVDWYSLKIHHPAYRRAIPHSRSFLRELQFDEQVLTLAHEITHVLSMNGVIGNALAALRVAYFDAELNLWSSIPDADQVDLGKRILEQHVANLQDNDGIQLFNAELCSELAMKAQMLQDAWTPWFEGLAVFSESAADPALDANVIGPVVNCLRSMVDFRGRFDEETGQPIDLLADYNAYTQEFEERCSAAIQRVGPTRLSLHLREDGTPYFAGYLAVRAVAHSIRSKVSRSLNGTDIFNILLHATRYGTIDAIPDLSLRTDIFAVQVQKLMAEWAADLADLSAEDIEKFIEPGSSEDPGRSLGWKDGRPVTIDDPSTGERELELHTTTRLRQAFWSLADYGRDRNRFSNGNHVGEALFRESASIRQRELESERFSEQLSGYLIFLKRLIMDGSQLPIGSVSAKYYLNRDPESNTGNLAVILRTTEASVSSGQPSTDLRMFPVDAASSERIEEHFRETGNPRMTVTRVIDIVGLATVNRPLLGAHYFAYQYGDWFEVFGTTDLFDRYFRLDKESRDGYTNVLKDRLSPSPEVRLEQQIASGILGAHRTSAWIARSHEWSIKDKRLDLNPWAEHVKALADDVQNSSTRRARQADASRELLSALYGDAEFVDAVIDQGFHRLTASRAADRENLMKMLFKTAQVPVRSPMTHELDWMTGISAVPLFVNGPHGFDVGPSADILRS